MNNKEPGRDKLQKELEELKIAYKELSLSLSEKIKRQKETEDALRKSEQQSRALVEAIPDLMFRMNKRGVYLDYKADKRDLYYQSDSIIGKNNRDLTPPDFADLIEKKINKTLQTGKVQVFEYSLSLNHNPEPSDYEAWMVPSGTEEVTAIVRDITDRKRAERLHHEREINARAIIDASSDILLLIDRNGIIIDCNQTLASFLGLNPTDLTYKCIFDFFGEKAIAKYRILLDNIFTSDQKLNDKMEIAGRIFNYSAIPVKNEKNITTRVAIYAHDNTEQIIAHKALTEAKEIFTSFLENSPVYVFIKDHKIRPVRLSRNFESLLGLPLTKILGKTMFELYPPELAAKIVKDDLKVLREGKPIRIEEEFNDRCFVTIKFPVIIDRKPKYLAGYTIDITEQKLAENALRESEQRFKKVYTQGTTPIAMLDEHFRFISANQAFQETMGYNESSLLKMTFKEITHPDCIEKDLENINLLKNHEIEVYKTEKRYITSDKQVIWADAQVSIVRDKDEKFMYFLAIINNITAYKKAEADIRRKNEQLEKLNTEKDKFFSIIAHDLRSPFNTFLGFTEMMAEDLNTMTLNEIRKIAIEMNNSAANLYRLLENLLEWSMLQRGVKQFDPKVIELVKVIEESIVPILDMVRIKSIKMTIDIPESLTMHADENMLGTVIRNLLSNAVKFTHCGGRVSLKAMETDDANIDLIIEDTGIGMDEEMKNSLFDLGSQNNRRGTEGELSTGLGLLLCKEFIEKHGGSITVESEPGKGSTFFIKLKP